MGEAKRREELGLPPRPKKVEYNKSDRYISWLPLTKSRIKKYPYMGVVTMALGAIIFLVSGVQIVLISLILSWLRIYLRFFL